MTDVTTPLDHGPVRLRLAAAGGAVGIAAAAVRVLASGDYDEQHPLRAIAWAGDHPTMVMVVNLCELLAFGAIAFSCITLAGLVRGRGRWLTQIGGWGTAVTFSAVGLNSLGMVIAALGDYPHRAAAADVITHVMHSPQVAPLVVLLVASGLFPLLFGLGLCRSRLVGWWYAIAVVADTVLEIAVNGEGVVALLTQILPLAVVVGVWMRLLLARATTVDTPGSDRELETVTA